jgi:hypothetical protein
MLFDDGERDIALTGVFNVAPDPPGLLGVLVDPGVSGAVAPASPTGFELSGFLPNPRMGARRPRRLVRVALRCAGGGASVSPDAAAVAVVLVVVDAGWNSSKP